MNLRFFVLSLIAATWMLLSISHAQAATVTFGEDANQFTIEFVTIGNPGNSDDVVSTPSPDVPADEEQLRRRSAHLVERPFESHFLWRTC